MSENSLKALDILEFLKGLIKGLDDEGDAKLLLKCLKNADEFAEKMNQATILIKKMEIADIVKGLNIILGLLKQFSQAFKPCASDFDKIDDLIRAIRVADPSKMTFRIVSNQDVAIQLMNEYIISYSAKRVRTIGIYFGKILSFLLL